MFLEKKVDSVFAEVTHAGTGRLFQRRGAATPKARSPSVDSRDLRMTSLLYEADSSRVLEPSSAAHCKSSACQILRCRLIGHSLQQAPLVGRLSACISIYTVAEPYGLLTPEENIAKIIGRNISTARVTGGAVLRTEGQKSG